MSFYKITYNRIGMPMHAEETYVSASSLTAALDTFYNYISNVQITKIKLITDHFIQELKA